MTVAKLRVKSPSKEPVGYHRESSRLILGPQPIVLLACVAAVSVVSAGAAGPPAHDNGAANGGIRGRVALGRVAASGARRPTVSDLGTPRERDVSDRQKSVVYLETAPRGAFERTEPDRAVMNQRNEAFVPHLLAVTTGTIVDFPNSDPFYHNVFSLSRAHRFDLGRYATGKSKSVPFAQPGIVRVFCEIHSHMNAYILVFSHPFFTVTDAVGRYQIDNVPAGDYRAIAWNEGVASAPQPITVPDGRTTELDFALR